MKPARKYVLYYFMAALGFMLTIAMVIYPENAFDAAVRGLDVWWNIVFPALLPFFIAAEILMGIGVVHFMGVLLEPLMRPLFRVPGIGSFVMSVGLASGFPIGSILTAKLRRQKLCTKEEGERLMSFTNTADPLFMFGAVAVGMLAYPQIGYTIAAAHYLSSVSVGLLMRFHKPHAPATPLLGRGREFILFRACHALINARQNDNRSFGKVMGDAVNNSVKSLLLIGGFIISFSVLIELCRASGVIELAAAATSASLETLLLFFHGVLEITLGCQQAAQSTLNISSKIMAISAIIAWSGLSVHGQVASIISDTDLSIKPYLVARILHASLAAAYTALLFDLNLAPVFAGIVTDYGLLSLPLRYQYAAFNLGKALALWGAAGFIFLIAGSAAGIRIAFFKAGRQTID